MASVVFAASRAELTGSLADSEELVVVAPSQGLRDGSALRLLREHGGADLMVRHLAEDVEIGDALCGRAGRRYSLWQSWFLSGKGDTAGRTRLVNVCGLRSFREEERYSHGSG